MPQFEQFPLPDVGEGLTEAEIVQWHVVVGQNVEVNDVIVEIETAKSLVELPSPFSGVVAEILVEEGQTVLVGTPIFVVDTDPFGPTVHGAGGEALDPAGVDAPVGDESGEASVPGEAGTASSDSGAVLVGYGVASGTAGRRRRPAQIQGDSRGSSAGNDPQSSGVRPTLAKPPVRKIAKDLGIDLSAVSGTGPGGLITREDVLAQVQEAQPQQLATYPGDDVPWLQSGVVSADGRNTRVPVKSVRKRTAEAMVASAFSAPHVTEFQTVDVTKTMRLVEKLKQDKEFSDVRVSPLLIVAKALLLSVRRHPEINASWDEASQEIVYKHYVNLGIAAATPRGLVVPNIKDAHRLELRDIALQLAELTSTARAGKTTPKAMSDGTITITNVGSFGIDTGTPILNPGEAAILAFGAIRQQPWVHKGKIKIRWITQLALSFDHRLVDGALGSVVLADVARVLEDPAQGLVWG